AVDMTVDLGRRERAVPEQLLDRPQIGAAFEQMRREGMSHAMRVCEHTPQGRGVQATPARGDEERVLGAAYELRPRLEEIPRKPIGGLLAERNHAFLAALPEHLHLLLVERHVGQVEPDRLVAPQARRVHELYER